ncbi:MAG: hypothetical protein RR406_00105 [Bacilli bacterium]
MNTNIQQRGFNMFKEKANNQHQTDVLKCLTTQMENDLQAVNVLRSSKFEQMELNLMELCKANNEIGVVAALAKISFSAGSQIGLIIVSLSIADTLVDNELNQQFLVPGTDRVCNTKITKVFKKFGTGINVGYDKIFKKEEFIKVTSKDGRKQLILLAVKERINEFAEAIANIGQASQEDLVRIGQDLGIIATVMSEIEIDAAKKPELKKGLLEISEFMSDEMILKSRNLSTQNNFNDIISKKKGYINNDVDEFKHEILNDRPLLFDYEKLVKENTERYYKSNQDNKGNLIVTQEQADKDLYKMRAELLKECVIVDPISQVSEGMIKHLNNYLEELVNVHYSASNMNLFSQFDKSYTVGITDPNEKVKIKEAVNEIQEIAVIIMEMINSTFKYNKFVSMTKVEELAMTGRNVIYTAGKIRGFSPQDTMFIAVNAGWFYRNNMPNSNYRFKAVEALFSNELKCHFNKSEMTKNVDIELPETIFEVEDAICDGQLLEFNKGQAYIGMDNDGGEMYALRIDKEDFTGPIIIKVNEEGYLEFKEYINPYVFEEVQYFLFDSISNVAMEDNVLSEDLIMEMTSLYEQDKTVYSRVYNRSKLIDTAPRNADDIALKIVAEKLAKPLANWSNYMQFVLDAEFKMHSGDNKMYMTKLNEEGKESYGRMLGDINDFYLTDKLSNAKAVNTIATPVGAILIAK